jgi:hypothetical protein
VPPPNFESLKRAFPFSASPAARAGLNIRPNETITNRLIFNPFIPFASFLHQYAHFLIETFLFQQYFLKSSNASLSRANLTTSGEDAGENIMAATSACGPAKIIPEQ